MHSMKVALITGVTGQDGSYLAEYLLEKGYEVHGIKRRGSLFNTQRVDHIYEDPHVDNQHFVLHYGDLSDSTNLIRIVQEVQPDEVYNLGAQSHVAVSFESPEYTADVDALGCLKRSVSVVWKRIRSFTRPLLPSCMDWCRKFLRKKQHRSTHALPMQRQSCTPTGLRSITARHTGCMPVMAFCLITNLLAEAKPS